MPEPSDACGQQGSIPQHREASNGSRLRLEYICADTKTPCFAGQGDGVDGDARPGRHTPIRETLLTILGGLKRDLAEAWRHKVFVLAVVGTTFYTGDVPSPCSLRPILLWCNFETCNHVSST